MNSALLYRQRSRSIFWIAFMTELAIHIGAVALAKNKSPTVKLEVFIPLADIEFNDVTAPEQVSEESVISPQVEEIHADQDGFPKENFKRLPVVRYRKATPALVRGTTP